MTLSFIKQLLETTGYPVAYHHFNKKPTIPFLVYMCEYENITGSDLTNDLAERSFAIELYTERKDILAERKVEQLLKHHFTKMETYIPSESLFQVRYEFSEMCKL